MSGLGKFQDSEAWRHQLRAYLLKGPSLIKPKMAKPESRYSLDIDEDLQRPKAQSKPPSASTSKIHLPEETICQVNQGLDGTTVGVDDTFCTMERMCDKSGSDPDSTLFQYLRSDDKIQVLAQAKERNESKDKLEMESLNRLMAEIDTEEMLDLESPVKGVECTQLEDIEAPSRFWDNEADMSVYESSQVRAKTSPVKMVGLMRPSTILEANETDTTNVSSLMSFQSALTPKTSVSSSCYETATDGSLGEKEINVDDLLFQAIRKAKPLGMSAEEEQELIKELTQPETELIEDETIVVLSSSEDEQEEEQLPIKNELMSEDDNKENKSMHFNDTMEEMEYMLQKGQEYMAQPQLVKQQTFVLSPTKTPSSPAKATKPQPSLPSRFAINMALPKKKFFDTPTTSAIQMRYQSKLKHPYENIISPIRTYTQKSGTAPLMSQFRSTNADLGSLANAELEQESRLCQLMMKQAAASTGVNPKAFEKRHIDGIPETARLLPKKAYISSEIKHVVDERTPMPMPNVPKIQKYLTAALQPTVLRHDGKMKMPLEATGEGNGAHVSRIPRRPNQSLADLSLASGDISLYTLKDAQKF